MKTTQPRQFLHLPTDAALRRLSAETRTLVLTDDELSTGNTFRRLTEALRPHLPKLQAVHWLCLTDFSPAADDGAVRHSLLRGRWHFETRRHLTGDVPTAQADAGRTVGIRDSGFGRLGISGAVKLPENLLRRVSGSLNAADRVLVLGVGEFIHPPAVFARELAERSGAAVWVQSSTRSPALVCGALQHKRRFADPYGEGVPYYLYNLPDPARYTRIFICCEHPANAALQAGAAELGAEIVCLGQSENLSQRTAVPKLPEKQDSAAAKRPPQPSSAMLGVDLPARRWFQAAFRRSGCLKILNIPKLPPYTHSNPFPQGRRFGVAAGMAGCCHHVSVCFQAA